MLFKIYYNFLVLIHTLMSVLKKNVPKVPNGNILLVIIGGIGDGILAAQAIHAMSEQCCKKGKQLFVMAGSPVCAILKMFINTDDINYISNDYMVCQIKSRREYNLLNEEIKSFSIKEWEQVIVQFNTLNSRAVFFTVNISAICRTALTYYPIKFTKKVVYCLMKRSFNQVITVSDELKQMQFSKKMAKVMEVQDYPIKITHLPRQMEYNRYGERYITVAVDSSNSIRRWAIEKFIELIECLLKKYPFDVILVGVNVSQDEIAQYEIFFRNEQRFENRIGKLSLVEWIELIRGAQFHIGVDSGSIHIAASVGTQAFCLTGVWDNVRFFPYQIDMYEDKTKEPICIYRQDVDVTQLTCSSCNARGIYGWKNQECYKQCRSGHPCLCLSKIEVNDVLKVIDQYMRREAE